MKSHVKCFSGRETLACIVAGIKGADIDGVGVDDGDETVSLDGCNVALMMV
jgi:hypothetical protein